MEQFKKWLMALVAGALFFGLFGCEGNEDPKPEAAADDDTNNSDDDSTAVDDDSLPVDDDSIAGDDLAVDDDSPPDQNYDYPPGPYGPGINDTMANLQFTGCDGKPLELKDYYQRGVKALWLDVGAGWCSACKYENPIFEDLYQQYKDQDVAFLYVLGQGYDPLSNEITIEFCNTYAKGQHMTVPMAIDPGFAQTGQYFNPTASGTPGNFLLDRNFKIRHKSEGWMQEGHPENDYIAYIEYLLGEE
jgi:thiol-disulfide isomerase/thioredoxin